MGADDSASRVDRSDGDSSGCGSHGGIEERWDRGGVGGGDNRFGQTTVPVGLTGVTAILTVEVGSEYVTNVDITSTITNVFPFQHFSYKNKPMSKFSIYLNNKPLSDNKFKDIDGNAIEISNTTFGIGNVSLDDIFVKSQNSKNTTIISSYEITSSNGSRLSYSPILTQSLSSSQISFII